MIRTVEIKGCLAVALFATIAGAAAAPVSAEEDQSDGKWHFSLTPYLWLPDINGTVTYKNPSGGGGSISAQVDDGRVVLSGWVTMPFKRDDLERRVRKVDGVMSVDNKIGVLPVSQFDDELRFRIARAIYSHSSFWNYAAMANPPIRVVVNGGRVTLEGVVQSNVERMLARSLASGFGEFSLKNELKTDAEVREAMEARKSN